MNVIVAPGCCGAGRLPVNPTDVTRESKELGGGVAAVTATLVIANGTLVDVSSASALLPALRTQTPTR